MSPPMVRKQIYLTAELDERLRREAKRQRRSEAEILREALAAHLNAGSAPEQDAAADPIWGLVGIASSRDRELSERVDEILYGKPTAPR